MYVYVCYVKEIIRIVRYFQLTRNRNWFRIPSAFEGNFWTAIRKANHAEIRARVYIYVDHRHSSISAPTASRAKLNCFLAQFYGSPSFYQRYRLRVSTLFRYTHKSVAKYPNFVRDSNGKKVRSFFFSCRSLPQLYTKGKRRDRLRGREKRERNGDGEGVSFSRHLRESRWDEKRSSIEFAGNRELILENCVSIFPSTEGVGSPPPSSTFFGKIKKSTPSTPL